MVKVILNRTPFLFRIENTPDSDATAFVQVEEKDQHLVQTGNCQCARESVKRDFLGLNLAIMKSFVLEKDADLFYICQALVNTIKNESPFGDEAVTIAIKD